MKHKLIKKHQKLTPIEKFCAKLVEIFSKPTALLLACGIQLVWVFIGQITHKDPFPYVFLLTCSNILQLILMFVINVAARHTTELAEQRAEADHEAIAEILASLEQIKHQK